MACQSSVTNSSQLFDRPGFLARSNTTCCITLLDVFTFTVMFDSWLINDATVLHNNRTHNAPFN